MKTFVIWVLLFIAAEAIIFVLQFLLRKKEIKNPVRIVIIVLKLLLAVAFAGLVMAGPVFLRPVQPLLVALYAALFADAVVDLIYTLVCIIRKKERKFSAQKVLSVIFGILFFVYGTVNMQIVTPNYHTYTSSKLASEHKLIFVADLHVGSSQNFSTTEKIIADIKAQKPDFIILGGDITDDYTTKEEMEQTYKLFGEIGSPVYFIFGNHEVVQHAKYMKNGLNYTEKELIQTMENNSIIILKDEYANIAPDLLLLGREDAATDERLDISALPNPDAKKFLIVADHQPVKVEDNLKAGTDLQLSGHTHAGQMFPLRMLYSVIGDVVGDYEYGDAVMNVSSGACGWRVPFRTDSHCHFEVVTLKPE